MKPVSTQVWDIHCHLGIPLTGEEMADMMKLDLEKMLGGNLKKILGYG